MTSDVGHVLLAICKSPLDKCLCRFSDHFLSGLFVSLILNCMSYLYILYINLLSVISFVNIFLPFCRLSFYFVDSFICSAKACEFWEFPGGPVVRTQCFHCMVPGFIPGQGTKSPQAAQHNLKKKKKLMRV